MPLSFSIVISTHNHSHTLGNILHALRYLRHPHFEVIVVKGPSTDDTDAVLLPYLQDIRLGHCAEAHLSKSQNIGLAMAQGDIVCFIEGDAIPEPDWLNELEAAYITASIAGVGGYVLDKTGIHFESQIIVSDRFGQDQHFTNIEKAQKSKILKQVIKPMHYLRLPQNNASFRRNVLLQLGKFDEKCDGRLSLADISLRLIEAGYKITYTPTARVHHTGTVNPMPICGQEAGSLYSSAYSYTYFAIKHAKAKKTSKENITSYTEHASKPLKKALAYAFLTFKLKWSEYKALLKEIDRGTKNGIEQACYLSAYKAPSSTIKAHTGSQFQQFPVLLPAAQRLHIGIVWQLYPAQERTGGIVVWLHEVATGLAKLGHEITFFTHTTDQKSITFEEGTWVHRTVKTRTKARFLFLLFGRIPSTPAIPRLRKRILRGIYQSYDAVMRMHHRRKFDVICSPAWGMEGTPFIADGKIPTVISMHSSWKFMAESKSEEEKKRFYKSKKHQQFIYAEEWTFKNATHLLANSNAIVRDTEALYNIKIDPDRVTVVPHGIKDLLADVNQKNTHPHAKASIKEHQPLRIMSVGRLERRKATDILLETLPALLTRYPMLEVHLVGDYSVYDDGINYRKSFLEKYAQAPWLDRVHFEGLVSESTLLEFYQKIDIFVAPSRYESFGLIYVEAMIFGKPCIGTYAGGIPEVITHNETGLLVPVNDVEKLSEALSLLIEDASLRQTLGQKGRALYEAQFTETVMVKRIAALLQKVSDAAKSKAA